MAIPFTVVIHFHFQSVPRWGGCSAGLSRWGGVQPGLHTSQASWTLYSLWYVDVDRSSRCRKLSAQKY